MKKSSIKVLPEYYDNYINEIGDVTLSEALKKNGADLLIQEKKVLLAIGEKVYSSGKWTVKDILQHIIDSERVFSYRALRIARNDKTPLPGFDENQYVPESKTSRRSVDQLLSELESVRNSGIIMFESFNDEMLLREGICSGKNISVIAIGFVIAGHALHHINVIKEKYLPLI